MILQFLIMISIFVSDWNWDPIMLLPENDLPAADIFHWFVQALPDKHMGPPKTLIQLLASILNQTEGALWQQVHALICQPLSVLKVTLDKWLIRCKMNTDKYAKITLSHTKQVDCFWLPGNLGHIL